MILLGTGSEETRTKMAQVAGALRTVANINPGRNAENLQIYNTAIEFLTNNLPGFQAELLKSQNRTKALGHAFTDATNVGKSFDKMVQNMGRSSSVFSEYIGQLDQLNNMFSTLKTATKETTFEQYFQKENAKKGVFTAEGEAILNVIAATDKNLAQRLKGMKMSDVQEEINKRIATVLDEEFRIRLKMTKLQEAFIRAGKGLTRDQKARLQLEYNRQKTIAEIDKIQTELNRKDNLGVMQGETRTRELTAQQQLLQAQLEIIQRQQDEIAQLGDAAATGLESSMKTNLAAVLKGEESSIKDAAIKIAQGMIGNVADKLAEQMTGKFMDKLLGVEDPAVAMKNAHVEGSETGKAKLKQALEEGSQLHYDKIVAACEIGANKLAAGVKGQDPSAVGPSPSQSGSNNVVKAAEAAGDGILQPSGKIASANLEETVLTDNRQAGGLAGLFTVFAQVDGNKFSAFLIESGTEGFTIGAEEKKLGMK